jgi:transcriptional regulator with PAS, ATPase and Fis domain
VGTLAVIGGPGDAGSFRRGRLVLVGNGVTIGRRPPTLHGLTSLTLADKTVSSFHARIKRMMLAGYTIEDQRSTNGTHVNGRPISGEVPLPENALIFLGGQILVFRTMTEAEIAAVETEAADPIAPVPTLCPALAVVCMKLRRLAPSATELFLLGETGVGKEVFANAIHRRSGRSGPLLAINCAALPRELVESELFGYERGAHSTAKAKKPGLIAAADRGTLFLDELAEMPLDVQSKLLRFLQDRTYTPIGATRMETADVRIVAASSRVAETTGLPVIQEALLGRLGAHPIHLPPLRDRKEDLGRLLAHFLGAVADTRPIETEACHALFLYDWPHNIRELQKVVNEAELLSQGSPAIGFDHLPPFISAMIDSDGTPEIAPTGTTDPLRVRRAIGSGGVSPLDPKRRPTWDDLAPLGAPAAPVRRRRPVPSEHELRAMLRKHDGNVSEVARQLDRQWAVLWRTMRRYGISPNEFKPEGADPEPSPPPPLELDAADDGNLAFNDEDEDEDEGDLSDEEAATGSRDTEPGPRK